MFNQVDRSIERSTGELGIGLALLRELVEMRGGTVSAASEGDTTCTVRLPDLTAYPVLVPGPAERAEPVLGGVSW